MHVFYTSRNTGSLQWTHEELSGMQTGLGPITHPNLYYLYSYHLFKSSIQSFNLPICLWVPTWCGCSPDVGLTWCGQLLHVQNLFSLLKTETVITLWLHDTLFYRSTYMRMLSSLYVTVSAKTQLVYTSMRIEEMKFKRICKEKLHILLRKNHTCLYQAILNEERLKSIKPIYHLIHLYSEIFCSPSGMHIMCICLQCSRYI